MKRQSNPQLLAHAIICLTAFCATVTAARILDDPGQPSEISARPTMRQFVTSVEHSVAQTDDEIQNAASIRVTAHSDEITRSTTGSVGQWIPTFGPQPGVDDEVRALTVFNDGAGEALYVGGEFTVAGSTPIKHLAKWDGTSWSPVGGEFDGPVNTFLVRSTNTGPELYAAGRFSSIGGLSANGIAKWNGKMWSPLGDGFDGEVYALALFDDGSGDGECLIAGGSFIHADGATVNKIAKWNGESWSPLGEGVQSTVFALAVFQGAKDERPQLYAGGSFHSAGGLSANHLASWDGSTWSAVEFGTSGSIYALEVFDDGAGLGERLFVGGDFATAGAGLNSDNVAIWDGQYWEFAGFGGYTEAVRDFTVFQESPDEQPTLVIACRATAGIGNGNIARWTGAGWKAFGIFFQHTGHIEWVNAITGWQPDPNQSATLYAGGTFRVANGRRVNHLISWSSSNEWSTVGHGVNDRILDIELFDDGSGPAMFISGFVTHAGGTTVGKVAKWDGDSWSDLNGGLHAFYESAQFIECMEVFDDGASDGPSLFVGGSFSGIGESSACDFARWDGESWSEVVPGFRGEIHALSTFDDGQGEALYLAGQFAFPDDVGIRNIARWDGTTLAPLGEGLGGTVYALEVFDDGGGPALYAGGQFGMAPGNRIAKWDGVRWTPLLGGVNARVEALLALECSTIGGPHLVVGGYFTMVDGMPTSHLALWDGTAWTPFQDGPNGNVRAIAAFDVGNGAEIVVGGEFWSVGQDFAPQIARWDGLTWSALDPMMNAEVEALHVIREPLFEKPSLLAGGRFSTSASGDSYLARLVATQSATEASDVNGDDLVDGADLAFLLSTWGECACYRPCAADLDRNGVVDGADLSELLNHWSP